MLEPGLLDEPTPRAGERPVEPAPAPAQAQTPRLPAAPRTVHGQEAAPSASGPDPAALERAAEVLRQIRLELRPETREARIQLRPLELGRIAIRLELTDGGTRAELYAERAETLELLARHVPELRAALERDGIPPGEVALRRGFEGFDASSERGSERAPAQQMRASRAPVRPSRALVPALAAAVAGASGIDLYA